MSDTNNINIEDIMNEIRAEIKEKGYTADMLSFSEVTAPSVVTGGDINGFNSAEYQGVVAYLGANSALPLSMPLHGNPIIVFIKKIIRKLTRVTIRPVAQHQTEYNAYTAHALNMVGGYIAANGGTQTLDELTEKIDTLELKLKTAVKEIDRLNARISELESKNK